MSRRPVPPAAAAGRTVPTAAEGGRRIGWAAALAALVLLRAPAAPRLGRSAGPGSPT
jgi:hypothetical protein